MNTLQIGIENTLYYQRSTPDVSVTKIEYYDTITGTLVYTDDSPINITDEGIVAAATSELAVTIPLSGPIEANRRYVLRADPAGSAPDATIDVISIDADDKIEIKYPLTRSIAAGTRVKSVLTTSTYTPADTTYRAVRVVWYLSTGRPYSQEYLLLKKFVLCPIDHQDIVTRWSRIQNQEPGWQRRACVGWAPQISEAWARITADFYIRGILIDNVINIEILRDLTLLHVERILTEMGADPTTGESRLDRLRELERKVETEMNKVMQSPLIVDAAMDNKVDERTARRPLRLGWESGSDPAAWRRN